MSVRMLSDFSSCGRFWQAFSRVIISRKLLDKSLMSSSCNFWALIACQITHRTRSNILRQIVNLRYILRLTQSSPLVEQDETKLINEFDEEMWTEWRLTCANASTMLYNGFRANPSVWMVSDEPSMSPVSFSMLLSSSRFIASPTELRNVTSKLSSVETQSQFWHSLIVELLCNICNLLVRYCRIVYEWGGIPWNWGYNSMMIPSYWPTETQPGRETRNLLWPWDLSISIKMMDDNRQFLQRNVLRGSILASHWLVDIHRNLLIQPRRNNLLRF